MVKNVQRLDGNISALSTVNRTIDEIDPSRAFVRRNSIMRQGNQNDELTFIITSPTNVEVKQTGDDSADYAFEVVEYY